MIRKFLKGLPYHLTRPMFSEYESKKRELARWKEQSKSQRLKPFLSKSNEIHFIFAIGIYYRWVVAPITRSGDFFERGNLQEYNDVVLGGKRLDTKFRETVFDAKGKFYEIIDWYGLSESFFSLTDVRSIVLGLVAIEERRRNGQR